MIVVLNQNISSLYVVEALFELVDQETKLITPQQNPLANNSFFLLFEDQQQSFNNYTNIS